MMRAHAINGNLGKGKFSFRQVEAMFFMGIMKLEKHNKFW
jgi:hypothetical protein